MTDIEDGGPAFPTGETMTYTNLSRQHPGMPDERTIPVNSGMTLRQYAAIKLKQPDSGIDWLDEMIKKSMRDDFAGQALQGLLSKELPKSLRTLTVTSYEIADAMIKARSAK